MSKYEQQMNLDNFEDAAMGDMPNLEGLKDPEVMSALAHIDEAIQSADQNGEAKYGAENWDLINGK